MTDTRIIYVKDKSGSTTEHRVRTFFSHERLIVAFDPDSRKPGVAYVQNAQVQKLASLDLFEIQELVPELKKAGALILMEDILTNNAVHGGSRKRGVRENRIRSVGQAQTNARLLIELFGREGVEYLLIKPLRMIEKRNAKEGPGAAEYFNALTGWSSGSNPDKRDAALIALYGLPYDYKVCDELHVYTRSRCPSCAEKAEQKRKRAARAAAKKKVKAA